MDWMTEKRGIYFNSVKVINSRVPTLMVFIASNYRFRPKIYRRDSDWDRLNIEIKLASSLIISTNFAEIVVGTSLGKRQVFHLKFASIT